MVRVLEAALGAWLVLAGLFLSRSGSPGQLTALVGGAALLLVVLAERPARRGVGFSVVLLGCALMLAPLALGDTVQGEALREVLTGFAVTGIALAPLPARRGMRLPAARRRARA